MTGELTIFRQGGQVSTAFQGVHLPTQRLDDGVAAGFAKVSYKGSKWGIKYQGDYHPVQARMPDNTLIQSPFFDCVLLKAAGHPSKAWYEGIYAEGDSAPPDCWSTNGMKPDIGVPKMQCPTCLGCPHNVWGSKVNRDTGEATRGKACMDSMRIAVVPVGDIENKFYGGPMMLNVPPTSLKRLGPYQNGLGANGFHYCQVWTRITFEPQSAYPLFVFDAISALNDVQAQQVVKMLGHPLIERILNTELRTAEAWDDPSLNAVRTPPAQPQPSTMTGYTAAQPQAAQPQAAQPPMQPPPPTPPVAAAAPAQPQPQQPAAPPDDGMTPPDFLRRAPPASGPAPGIVQTAQPQHTAPAQQEVIPPEQPKLPAGMTLPPGMTPEMAAAFLAQFNPAQQAAQEPKGRGRGGRGRTPPVTPTNMDSSQATAPQQAQQPQPAVMTMVTPGQANGAAPAGGPDQAVSSIMSTVKGLL